ncbi:MAG: cell division protein FtsB [Gammaproteobacteria bacterium]|jgi:cell division protein FtsB|nr:MAG: cell division protein FtsB [Gammaproteobacteria bacterium]
MKLLAAALLILLAALQYRLWTGNGGIPHVRRMEQAKAAQLEENRKLEERNRSLSAEVIDLKQGLDAIEERARTEMGMIKQDEVFIQVIDRKSLTPPVTR